MPSLPRLIAFDADDLSVIAANLQDALVRVGDMAYIPRSKQFAMITARFDWIDAAKSDRACGCERCRTGLHFGRVLKVSCRGFCRRDEAEILNLLDIAFRETSPPAGIVEFIFSAGRALRLEVECLEAEIRDLGDRWKAGSVPCHSSAPVGKRLHCRNCGTLATVETNLFYRRDMRCVRLAQGCNSCDGDIIAYKITDAHDDIEDWRRCRRFMPSFAAAGSL